VNSRSFSFDVFLATITLRHHSGSGACMASHSHRSPLGDEALLREAQVCEALCISRATLKRLIAKGLFPAPFRITPRVTVWRLSAVRAYIQAQSAKTHAAPAPPRDGSR
jgi:predicted DNA-binding transcriptional regulator AlpA